MTERKVATLGGNKKLCPNLQLENFYKFNKINTLGIGLTDITLYAKTKFQPRTPEYLEEKSLQNFVCDLYHYKMDGYKPPKTSRITVQPAFHEKWEHPGKFGSIAHVAPKFDYKMYLSMDQKAKYKYILDVIHDGALRLCDYYQDWDRSVFQKAYQEVLNCDFVFRADFTTKQSRDRKKKANISIEKTTDQTSIYVFIESEDGNKRIKLLDKQNMWWYDSCYVLAKNSKWFDSDRFGISYKKGMIEMWYSITNDEVVLMENGVKVSEFNFSNYFLFG